MDLSPKEELQQIARAHAAAGSGQVLSREVPFKRLNLGAGDRPLEGWENWDAATGQEAFPLELPDGCLDHLRASHILEHFPHAKAQAALNEWVRVVRPGGAVSIAVPDFALLAKGYLAGKPWPFQGFFMGGQLNERDFHKSIFDRESLEEAMREAGLCAIHRWQSTNDDGAAMPISLNLVGYKRTKLPRACAVMSVPRLGFMDNFASAQMALRPLGIDLAKFSGAFWGQCLTRGMESLLEQEKPAFVLTLDYDTIYTKANVEDLLMLACAQPDADAIAPLQAMRGRDSPLFVMAGEGGKTLDQVDRAVLEQPLVKVRTAHFGCTVIRAERLASFGKPWFWSRPDPEGGWGEGRIDDDIWFWHEWEKQGRSLYLAPRVVVGHAEMMIRWPDRELKGIHQHPSEFWKGGAPAEAWR
jgi:predicted SAM-dependent methyltransferase